MVVTGPLMGCSQGPSDAWKGPGWYLELPYAVIAGGPSVQGGPYSYDECEQDRLNRAYPDRYLCMRELKQPRKFGSTYTSLPSSPVRRGRCPRSGRRGKASVEAWTFIARDIFRVAFPLPAPPFDGGSGLSYPIVMRLALPPAAAVLMLSEISSNRNSSG